MRIRRRLLGMAAACASLSALGTPADIRAQPYPSRPIKLLVGFAAGGNFDLVARLIGPWMAEQLRHPVVVENKAGAGGNLATEAAIRASADGYTLLLAGAVNAINATLYERLPFDFIKEVTPIAGVVRFPNVLCVASTFPARTLPEFVNYARANPGRLNQGSSGNGTTQHLAGALFKSVAGVEFQHVPYRGASLAIADLIGGHVQVIFEPLPASIEHIRSGRLRALAVTTARRSDALPDVPSVSEFFSGYEASGWTGLCAPGGTPVELVHRLNATVNAGLSDVRLRARITELGAEPLSMAPDEFARLITDETLKWGRVIRANNIKVT